MNEQEFILLLRFVDRQILTDVDGGLRRAVKSLLKENQQLREQKLEKAVAEMEKEYWDRWESET